MLKIARRRGLVTASRKIITYPSDKSVAEKQGWVNSACAIKLPEVLPALKSPTQALMILSSQRGSLRDNEPDQSELRRREARVLCLRLFGLRLPTHN
jgi:hypothetical protein